MESVSAIGGSDIFVPFPSLSLSFSMALKRCSAEALSPSVRLLVHILIFLIRSDAATAPAAATIADAGTTSDTDGTAAAATTTDGTTVAAIAIADASSDGTSGRPECGMSEEEADSATLSHT